MPGRNGRWPGTSRSSEVDEAAPSRSCDDETVTTAGGCCSPGHEPADVAPAHQTSGGSSRAGAGAGADPRAVASGWGASTAGRTPGDGEGPVHAVELDAFAIDAHAVTQRRVRRVRRCDRARHRGRAVRLVVRVRRAPARRLPRHPRAWRRRRGGGRSTGADWRHPEGPQSDLDGRGDHPVRPRVVERRQRVLRVVRDAPAHRGRVGVRRARRARQGALFPWGDDLEPDGVHRMNVFQGEFPGHNTGADGFAARRPSTPSRRTATASTT